MVLQGLSNVSADITEAQLSIGAAEVGKGFLILAGDLICCRWEHLFVLVNVARCNGIAF